MKKNADCKEAATLEAKLVIKKKERESSIFIIKKQQEHARKPKKVKKNPHNEILLT